MGTGSSKIYVMKTQQDEEYLKELTGKEEFAYWIKCVLAQNRTRVALLTVVEEEFNEFIKGFKTEEISTFCSCLQGKPVFHLSSKRPSKQTWQCHHSECKQIFLKILKNHIPDKTDKWNIVIAQPTTKISFQPTKETEEKEFWLIARLYTYIESEKEENLCNSLQRLDLPKIIKLMRSCKLFEFDGSAEIYYKIIDIRNTLMHSNENMVSKEDFEKTFECLRSLLKQFDGISVCERILSQLTELELYETTEDPSKFQQDAEEAMQTQVTELKSDLANADKTEAEEIKQMLSEKSKTLALIKNADNAVFKTEHGQLRIKNEDYDVLKKEIEQLRLKIESILEKIDETDEERMMTDTMTTETIDENTNAIFNQLRETYNYLQNKKEELQNEITDLKMTNKLLRKKLERLGDNSEEDLGLSAQGSLLGNSIRKETENADLKRLRERYGDLCIKNIRLLEKLQHLQLSLKSDLQWLHKHLPVVDDKEITE